MESGSSHGCPECCSDFGFGFNDVKFSDRTLLIELIPESTGSEPEPIDSLADRPHEQKLCRGDRLEDSNGNSSSTTQMKTIHINTLILAAKSPFFYKLFSNGMAESNQRHVTLQIQESEEAAFMDLLKFMYTNTLSRTTSSALLDVLMAADKYEVASCVKYCFQLLQKLPMTYESALLYLDLPSTILLADTVQPLTDAAREFLVARFKDMSKFEEEMHNLPLAGIEAVLLSDDLQVASEDSIYDFVMKWAQTHYTKSDERREIITTRLLRLIRFPFMSHLKLEEVLTCTDITLDVSSKLVFHALSPETQHRQLSRVSQERVYKYRPVRVIRLDSPREECVVYLDLKHEECARLLPSDEVYSQDFHWRGQAFYLLGMYRMDKQSFGLFLGTKRSVGFVVEFEFSSRRKPGEEFVGIRKLENDFAQERDYGLPNLFGEPWAKFIAEDSPYFINGVLHLRAVLKIKK